MPQTLTVHVEPPEVRRGKVTFRWAQDGQNALQTRNRWFVDYHGVPVGRMDRRLLYDVLLSLQLPTRWPTGSRSTCRSRWAGAAWSSGAPTTTAPGWASPVPWTTPAATTRGGPGARGRSSSRSGATWSWAAVMPTPRLRAWADAWGVPGVDGAATGVR
ncbi:hypothetical protein [Ornithinimicrobium sediminis]|uniref:hypothetical protein n=1 Tax=Ornithinimicrobium sediminis TaxID=2904603 RepID=UPI001E5357B0|nr:hypothetical protein [Ornithinimicrobium sediminis]MCE0485820.1 hypothetical protein [Ornithinimicrobium sediminis]